MGFDNPGLDISSLIDVCFLLFIYFIVTSTLTPREQDLSMGSPGETTPMPDIELETIYIHVAADGVISTGLENDRQVLDMDAAVQDLPLLRAELKLFKSGVEAAGAKPLVQVDAEAEASQQRVIDVLNALAAEGIHAVTFTDHADP